MPDILLSGEFGQAISSTIKKYNFRTNLEIGSWDGTGSTQCFIDGMKDLEYPKSLTCIEIQHKDYIKLVENVKQYDWITCINGTTVTWDNVLFKDYDEIWDSPYNGLKINFTKDVVYNWFTNESSNIQKFDTGFLENDNTIYDVVMIDGSEFCGYTEYMLVKDRTKCLILDDCVRSNKCNQIYNELKLDDKWLLLYDFPNLLNGESIFIKNK